MITFYSDRIEIVSNGGLSPKLTISDFYKGASEPVNRKLSDIFLQLRISEKTGRGVPTIVARYGEEAFEFEENWITVTIPFSRLNVVDYQVKVDVVNKTGQETAKKLNKTQLKIVELLRNDPNITAPTLMKELQLGHTAVQNNLNKLQGQGVIERIGARKGGYWKVLD